MIRRLLIANRGEIAVRIIRSARALGIETVAVYSDADRTSLHVRLADRALCIGPARAAESYLKADAILAAALGSGCDAIHPGYGFLSENAAFARECERNAVCFVGPSAAAIDGMGDKINARATARRLGVPTIPGSEHALADFSAAEQVAKTVGYPLLMKASAGGGGRGMRVVRDPAELAVAFAEAGREATAAFGDGTLYAERFLENVRHVEIQLLSDGTTHLHLGDRDCTLQRRSQKLLEEAPALIPAATRASMADAAVGLARGIDYRGAGTVEFVYHPPSETYYFLEMNTRIQVEHPVTEAITGIDIVAEQLRVAGGEGLSLGQEGVRLDGHAIECRINAEDSLHGFRPAPGRISHWSPPAGDGVRVDSHAYEGYVIPPFYDSMLAKLIVHGRSRGDAIARTRDALAEFTVGGLPTTLDFHRLVLADSRFERNETDTKWVEREFLAEHATA